MAASDAMKARVRGMTGELTEAPYTDAAIAVFIERYPIPDYNGELPLFEGEVNPDWIPTYDMNAAAADIWDEKAALLVGKFDISADGANMSRSQLYDMAQRRARHFRSRRAVGATSHVTTSNPNWLGTSLTNSWDYDDID